MIEMQRPEIKCVTVDADTFYARFEVEPLERGFGITLGNSLRRILLSSLPGYAIDTIKIDGISHEFSTIPGVSESVTDLILNLKQVCLKSDDRDQKQLSIRAKGPCEVTAADIITDSKHLAGIFEKTTALCGEPKKVSNWLMVDTLRLLKEKSMDASDIKFSPENLAKLIKLTGSGIINSTVAKEVYEEIFEHDTDPDVYIKENGLAQVNDESALRETIQKVIDENPQSVEDYRNGKEKAMGFLVGQTMKAMAGKANPGMVNNILKELL